MKGESKFGNPNVTYELNIVDLQSFDLCIYTITLSELDKWMENLARPLTFSVKNQIDEWIHLKINIDILIDCISFYVLFENTGILLIWRRHQSHGWAYSHYAGRDLQLAYLLYYGTSDYMVSFIKSTLTAGQVYWEPVLTRFPDRSTDRRTDGQTGGQTDQRTDGQTDRQTDGRTDGRTDRERERERFAFDVFLLLTSL